MGTIHFNRGFHLASMLVALAAGVASGQLMERAKSPRSLDVSEYRVLGQGCGNSLQRERTYAAVEEDDLPGPTCVVVTELVERDYE